MAGKPIAAVTNMHVCPMVTGVVPHVGGPIIGPGAPNVMINGKPAALMGDMCTCMGPPDVIAMGNPSILINGIPAVCQGDMTAHGGIITVGEPNVMIGTAVPKPSAIMPIKEIPFPKINIVDRAVAAMTGNGGKLKEAEKNQEAIKEQAKKNEEKEPEPVIYNLRWVKGTTIIRERKEIKKVNLVASVLNVPDGGTVNFSVKKKDKDGKDTGEVVQLSGQVKDGKVEVEWETEEIKREAQS